MVQKNVKDEVAARLFEFFDDGQINVFVALFNNKGQLVVGYNNDGGPFKVQLTSDYCDDKWYHIAIVHDGKTMTVYINNKRTDSVTGPPIINVSRNYNYIGRGSQSNSSYSTMSIDDFRIYNTNLAEKDLTDIFHYKKNKDKSKKDTKNDNKKSSGAAKNKSLKEIFTTNYKKNKAVTIFVTCIISIVVIIILAIIGFFIKKRFFSS